MGFNNVQTLLQNVRDGQLRALAVAEPEAHAGAARRARGRRDRARLRHGAMDRHHRARQTPKEIVERLSQETLAVMRPGGHQATQRSAGDADGDRPRAVRAAHQEGPRQVGGRIKTAGIRRE